MQYEVVQCTRFKQPNSSSGRVLGLPAACSLVLGADDERPRLQRVAMQLAHLVLLCPNKKRWGGKEYQGEIMPGEEDRDVFGRVG